MKKEKHLIKQCIRGDKTAQFALVKRYSGMLMTVCRRFTHDDQMAKDLLQESFIQIFKKIDKYQPTGSLEAWLRTVTVRCALNYLKLNSNRIFSSVVELEQHSKSIEPEIFKKLHNEDIISLIQALPEGFRTVFNLYAVEGYSHREVADMLGISESASRSQLSRARAHLIKRMEHLKLVNYRSA